MKATVCRSFGNVNINCQRRLVSLLRLLQAPFEWVFWLLAQRIAKIEDFLVNNEGSS